jgi:GNAT superfamily N-acetyltransferase
MPVTTRNYSGNLEFKEEYNKIYDFLCEINKSEIVNSNFEYARLEWMFTHPMLDRSELSKIRVYEANGKIVGLVTYESVLGDAYPVVIPGYEYLYEEMMDYAINHLSKDGKVKFMIQDGNTSVQQLARSKGYVPTKHDEADSIHMMDDNMDYELPDGFEVMSLADEYDLYQLNKVLHLGFNHGPEYNPTDEDLNERKFMFSGPHNDLSLKIVVKNSDGEYVSFCGMWFDPVSKLAVVEPVATVPEYRKKGLGKAAVLEGVKRCKDLGAKYAIVGSNQQFYYNIGFNPFSTYRFWIKSVK